MPVMRLFCFYCSVRLGSLVVAGLGAFVPMVVLLATDGIAKLRQQAEDAQEQLQNYTDDGVFLWAIDCLRETPNAVFVSIMVYLALYQVSCVLMAIGVAKMKRVLLLPFIALDLGRLLCLTLMHVVGMMVIKKSINLGDLIAITIAGGFGLLFLFYMWACVVALFQILSIVQSSAYRTLYGDNPLEPKVVTSFTAEKAPDPIAPVNTPFYTYMYGGNYSDALIPKSQEHNEIIAGSISATVTDGNIFSSDFLTLQSRYNRGVY